MDRFFRKRLSEKPVGSAMKNSISVTTTTHTTVEAKEDYVFPSASFIRTKQSRLEAREEGMSSAQSLVRTPSKMLARATSLQSTSPNNNNNNSSNNNRTSSISIAARRKVAPVRPLHTFSRDSTATAFSRPFSYLSRTGEISPKSSSSASSTAFSHRESSASSTVYSRRDSCAFLSSSVESTSALSSGSVSSVDSNSNSNNSYDNTKYIRPFTPPSSEPEDCFRFSPRKNPLYIIPPRAILSTDPYPDDTPSPTTMNSVQKATFLLQDFLANPTPPSSSHSTTSQANSSFSPASSTHHQRTNSRSPTCGFFDPISSESSTTIRTTTNPRSITLREPSIDDFFNLLDEDLAEEESEVEDVPTQKPKVMFESRWVKKLKKADVQKEEKQGRKREGLEINVQEKKKATLPLLPPLSPLPFASSSSRISMGTVEAGDCLSLAPVSQGKLAAVAAKKAARLATKHGFDVVYVVNLWPTAVLPRSKRATRSMKTRSLNFSSGDDMLSVGEMQSRQSQPKMMGKLIAAYGLESLDFPFRISSSVHTKFLQADGWVEYRNQQESSGSDQLSRGFGHAFHTGLFQRRPSTTSLTAPTMVCKEDVDHGIVFVGYCRQREGQGANFLPPVNLDSLYTDASAFVDELATMHTTQQIHGGPSDETGPMSWHLRDVFA